MKKSLKFPLLLLATGILLLLLALSSVFNYFPGLNIDRVQVPSNRSLVHSVLFILILGLANLIGFLLMVFSGDTPTKEVNRGKAALMWVTTLALYFTLIETAFIPNQIFFLVPFIGNPLVVYAATVAMVALNSMLVYLKFKGEIRAYWNWYREQRQLRYTSRLENYNFRNGKH